MTEQNELINHPEHYNAGKIECIEFIEDQGLGNGFCRGNAIKYIVRAGRKDTAGEGTRQKAIEDLKKAVWYINREIERRQAALDGRPPVRPNEMDSNWLEER